MTRDETWQKPNHDASTRLCEGAHELYAQEKFSGWGVSTKMSPNIS